MATLAVQNRSILSSFFNNDREQERIARKIKDKRKSIVDQDIFEWEKLNTSTQIALSFHTLLAKKSSLYRKKIGNQLRNGTPSQKERACLIFAQLGEKSCDYVPAILELLCRVDDPRLVKTAADSIRELSSFAKEASPYIKDSLFRFNESKTQGSSIGQIWKTDALIALIKALACFEDFTEESLERSFKFMLKTFNKNSFKIMRRKRLDVSASHLIDLYFDNICVSNLEDLLKLAKFLLSKIRVDRSQSNALYALRKLDFTGFKESFPEFCYELEAELCILILAEDFEKSEAADDILRKLT